MEFKKDIRFSEKKVDESWKEQTTAGKAASQEPQKKTPETSKVFLGLVQSLGIQALMSLGAMPNPVTNETELNLEGAKEAIDALVALREKTSGNVSPEEKRILDGLISDLQIKFSQSV